MTEASASMVGVGVAGLPGMRPVHPPRAHVTLSNLEPSRAVVGAVFSAALDEEMNA